MRLKGCDLNYILLTIPGERLVPRGDSRHDGGQVGEGRGTVPVKEGRQWHKARMCSASRSEGFGGVRCYCRFTARLL